MNCETMCTKANTLPPKSQVATYVYHNCQKDGHDIPHRSKSEEVRKTSRRNENEHELLKRTIFAHQGWYVSTESLELSKLRT